MNNPTTTKPTSRYFAAENRSGFANTWDVLDVRTLDSVIVAGGQCVSLAQAGEL